MKALYEILPQMNPVFEATSIEMSYGLVTKDMGIGYCREKFLDMVAPIDSIVKFDFEHQLPDTKIAVAYKKENVSKLIHAFVTGLVKHCETW